MDTVDYINKINDITQNIPGLRKAGALFKYDGHMPLTSHYGRIDKEIRERDKYFTSALSKKIRQKKQLEEIDKEIENILIKGVDNL